LEAVSVDKYCFFLVRNKNHPNQFFLFNMFPVVYFLKMLRGVHSSGSREEVKYAQDREKM